MNIQTNYDIGEEVHYLFKRWFTMDKGGYEYCVGNGKINKIHLDIIENEIYAQYRIFLLDKLPRYPEDDLLSLFEKIEEVVIERDIFRTKEEAQAEANKRNETQLDNNHKGRGSRSRT